MRRPALLFLTVLLLWAIVAQVNHALSGAHVFIFAGGLFIVRAALDLPLPTGLAISLLAGGVCDANAPVPFGTHVLLFAAAHTVLFSLRDRLPHDATANRVVIALLANAAFFLALSLLRAGGSPAGSGPWPRLGADLACSEIFTALIAPWFFALQEHVLKIRGSPASGF